MLFGISPLMMGLTIVAFRTSAPEMAVSNDAVLDGATDLAIGNVVGNVVGNNICNVLLILGMSALLTSLVVNLQLVPQEMSVMISAPLLLLALGLDGKLSFMDGGILFGCMVAYTVFLIIQSRKETKAAHDECAAEVKPTGPGSWDSKLPAQLLLIAVGLAFLVIGSDWLVTASMIFAKALGVSDLVIGLTIVVAGTSMSEVATSVMAAIKGPGDIAVGNGVGCVTVNILGCLGISGMVSSNMGLLMPEAILKVDIWVMISAVMACLPVFMTGREIARWEGGVFLVYCAAYVACLILATPQHGALGTFSAAMMGFVIPVTVITLVVMLIKRGKTPDGLH